MFIQKPLAEAMAWVIQQHPDLTEADIMRGALAFWMHKYRHDSNGGRKEMVERAIRLTRTA